MARWWRLADANGKCGGCGVVVGVVDIRVVVSVVVVSVALLLLLLLSLLVAAVVVAPPPFSSCWWRRRRSNSADMADMAAAADAAAGAAGACGAADSSWAPSPPPRRAASVRLPSPTGWRRRPAAALAAPGASGCCCCRCGRCARRWPALLASAWTAQSELKLQRSTPSCIVSSVGGVGGWQGGESKYETEISTTGVFAGCRRRATHDRLNMLNVLYSRNGLFEVSVCACAGVCACLCLAYEIPELRDDILENV